MADQQQQEQLDRSVKFPVSDPVSVSAELPSSVDRASRFAAYDAAGAPIAAAGNAGPDPVPVTPFMATVLDDADAAAARGTLGATTIGGQVFTAVDAAAIRALIDAPQSNQGFTTGDVKLTMKSGADAGWVMMDDGTIGGAASGATTRANADTEPLFTLLWNNVSDTWAPVSGGRGASASADFAAAKTIALPKALGRALAVAGAGSGLTTRTLGETLGEETHTLTASEVPSMTYTVNAHNGGNTSTNPGGNVPGADGVTGVYHSTPNTTMKSDMVTDNGGDGAHNIMQPSAFLNVMVKL